MRHLVYFLFGYTLLSSESQSTNFSRKLGLNQFFSLMMANILGSVVHVGFFSNGLVEIPAFIISLLTMASGFWLMNKEKQIQAFVVLVIGCVIWTHTTEYVTKFLT